MSTPTIKVKVFPRPVIKAKMDVRFPGRVDVLSPILLDRTGGNYQFSFDLSALGLGGLYQPLDGDLTAIAALSTTAYGRSLLTLANATALAAEVDSFFLTPAEGNAAYQPLDSDLTAIAALTTATFGRSLLTETSATTLKTTLSLQNVDNTSDANKPVSTAQQTALNLKANLASPAFTGTPAAPTAAVDTNTTQLATTAMVLAQAAAATPLGNAATAVVGTSTRFARADHVHPGRERLSGARTYYVRSDGSDSNTGLVNSSGGAFLTTQKAWDVIVANLDLAGFTVTVQVADGTYTSALNITSGWVGGGNVTFQGNSGTPANVVISTTSADCFTVRAPLNGTLTFKDFELRTATSGYGLNIQGKTTSAVYSNIRFGACASGHISVNGGYLATGGGYAITGDAPFHIIATLGGTVEQGGITVTVSAGLTFSTSFIYFEGGSIVSLFSVTYSTATATGKRYNGVENSLLKTFGAGTASTYFPGNSNGTVATGAVQS